MLRGFIKVKCPHCGRVFIAPDMEDNAAVHSAPIHCPWCGMVFRPDKALFSVLARLLKSLPGQKRLPYDFM